MAASVPDSSDSRNHLRKHPPPDTLIAVDGVFLGFATIVLVILVGFALGHFGVLDMAGQRVLAEVAFQVGSPALMITVLSTADVHELFSRNLLATLAGVLVPATAFLVISRWWWQLPLSERVIGALASSYVNAGNLGLPIAAYVLGDAALVAPTLLLQLLIMQPLALTVLDHDRRGGAFRWGSILRRPLTNPLTLGALAGVALSATDTTLPPLLRDPIELIGGLAVPAMLLGYGVALRLPLKAIDAEMGFFAMQISSRTPFVSGRTGTWGAVPVGHPARTTLNPLPAHEKALAAAGVRSAVGFWEYPDDIRLYGISLSTNVAGWSVGAELSLSPNQPVQLNGNDLLYAIVTGRGPMGATSRTATAQGGGTYISGYDRLRKTLIKLNAAKTPMNKLKTLATVRPGDLAPEVPAAAERRTGLNMGQHQAITTKQWGITREAQDELAAASHHNLARAWKDGFFDDLVTPYLGQTIDQTLRADTSVEKLAKLRPVFGDEPGASMTAGNSTPLSDGAAVVLLADENWARERNLPALARIVDAETAAVDYLLGQEGLLMAPAHAAARLLTRNGMALQDFALYEIHEAFASTVLCTLAAWESDDYCRDTLGLPGALGSIDRSKLNVHGSSLAAGHPFAATGARILASLAKMLAAKGSGARGLISVCAAGGQGVVAIVEAI